MRKKILFPMIVSMLLFPTVAFTLPADAIFIGEFSPGMRCYQFVLDGYTVDVIYAGGRPGTGILIRLLSSPENPLIPSGYVYLYRASSNSTLIEWRINSKVLYFIAGTQNCIQVWEAEAAASLK